MATKLKKQATDGPTHEAMRQASIPTPVSSWDMAEELQKLKASGVTGWKFEALRIHIRGGKTLDQAFDEVNETTPQETIPSVSSPVAKTKRSTILSSVAVIKANEGKPNITVKGKSPVKVAVFKTKGDLDEFGFGSSTQVSFVVSHLEEGSFTKAQITEKFIAVQVALEEARGGAGFASPMMKASSLSVIFSDIVKPFGSYHASRSLIILTDPQTKIMSLEPRRCALVKTAITNGILASLKGFSMKKHPDKVKSILKKFNLPME